MKILFIIPSITNYYTFLEDIALRLKSLGHEVIVISSSRHISEIDCYQRPVAGTLHDIDFPRGFEFRKHLKTAKHLSSLVRQISPDVINVHFSAAMFTTALAKDKQWPRTIAMLHGLAFPILNGWRKLAIGRAERWAAKQMDQLILLNQQDHDSLSRYIPASRISVLQSYGLGCDLDKFDQNRLPAETSLRYHRRLSIREDDFTFTFVGRQVDFKGFDKLIRAFLALYEDHKNLKLILIGARDPLHPSNLTPSEENEMTRCPGIVNVGWKDNVQDYLSVIDVNVFPSEREGMPVNLMESLAMGVPVITTDSRGCNMVVDHDINGVILEMNDEKHIQEAMLELYLKGDKLNRLREGALKLRHRFDRQKFISEMVDIFAQPE